MDFLDKKAWIPGRGNPKKPSLPVSVSADSFCWMAMRVLKNCLQLISKTFPARMYTKRFPDGQLFCDCQRLSPISRGEELYKRAEPWPVPAGWHSSSGKRALISCQMIRVRRVDGFRSNHSKAIDLRDASIVLLGFRMGFRASDVLNLRFWDIDWKNRKISIVMKKTRTQITLPMPVDVGNAIYAYLSTGRPKSGSES